MSSKLLTAVLFVSLVAPAYGQESRLPEKEAGRVISVEGPAGAVMVFRGAKAYTVAEGDVLFAGDRVLTRADGKAQLVSAGCERSLDHASSITVNKEFCADGLITFAGRGLVTEAAAGLAVETAAAASPNLAPLVSLGASASALASVVPVDGAFN